MPFSFSEYFGSIKYFSNFSKKFCGICSTSHFICSTDQWLSSSPFLSINLWYTGGFISVSKSRWRNSNIPPSISFLQSVFLKVSIFRHRYIRWSPAGRFHLSEMRYSARLVFRQMFCRYSGMIISLRYPFQIFYYRHYFSEYHIFWKNEIFSWRKDWQLLDNLI